jgi:hypothetical protein
MLVAAMEGMIERTWGWGGAYGGGIISLFGAVNQTTTKLQKIKYNKALDGRWLIFYTQQLTKNPQT